MADFAFFLTQASHLRDRRRRFTLSAADLELFNPNTRACPVFRTASDVELTRKIYQRIPVLVREGQAGGNPWGAKLRQGLFHLTNDLRDGLITDASEQPPADDRTVPLYEAKLIWQFDHRMASYQWTQRPMVSDSPTGRTDGISAQATVVARYYCSPTELAQRLSDEYKYDWWLVYRDITNATNERTCVAALIPKVGVAYTLRVFVGLKASPEQMLCLLGNLNALVFDYVVRQSIGGTHLSDHIMKQLPVLPPSFYRAADVAYVASRVLELIYTADDMQPLADALRTSASPLAAAVPRAPYRWDEARRALLRAELDAWYARAYGLTRDELRYILDPADVHGPDFPGETFRVLKEKELAKFGEYRTRRLVLEAWDAWERRGDTESVRA
jgi:hypothetical protein